jgi:hypothetical protein
LHNEASNDSAAQGTSSPSLQSEPAAVSVVATGDAPACGLSESFVHATHDGRETVLYDDGVIVFRTPYRVNTDGAPNSYHPEDPGGSRGLAINTICNGANAYTSAGERVDYRQCERLIGLFREARAAGWPSSGARMQFYGVASSNSGSLPCIEDEGPYAGYFVSSTSVHDPAFGICDQRRYLDALSLPFIIAPGHANFRARGMNVRDLAVVYNPARERMVFAMVGDEGPAQGLGEGSVALNRTLAGRSDWPTTRRETYAFGLADAVTVVFPDASIGPPYTNERIAVAGQAALARFGGTERLTACAQALQ